jgi:lysophospholipase L1-like esterase
VAGFVYYDENADGRAGEDELVRLPDVSVDVGGRRGTTDARGRFVVEDVSEGVATARLVEEELPPFFEPGAPVELPVPQAPGTDVALAVTLPIGANQPNVYLAFGDSITAGVGSGDDYGYIYRLETDLTVRLGLAFVIEDAREATRSGAGVRRLGASIQRNRPAYTLILYGTNDWNRLECKDERFPCDLIDNLGTMVGIARSQNSLPVLSTLPPVNPLYVDRDAAARNEWVVRMNALIRELAAAEGAALADPHRLFMAEPRLETLFVDHVHPNDPGYELLSAAFYEAITAPRGAAPSP